MAVALLYNYSSMAQPGLAVANLCCYHAPCAVAHVAVLLPYYYRFRVNDVADTCQAPVMVRRR
jgi:hypothetical protein